jgi:hypothetical protein
MKRYSEEDKKWFVQEWEKSGKSKWAFATELGLNYQALSKWTRKPVPAAGFVEVGKKLEDIAELLSKTVSGIIVEQGSIRVHLPAGFTHNELVLVVQALRVTP